MNRRFTWLVAAVLGIVWGFSAGANAVDSKLDPLKVAPKMYTLLYENDQVRVMQVTFKPGEKIKKHSHPDHFVYVLESGKLKITKADKSSTENGLTAGQVIWIPAETHSGENTGTTTVRLLVTELKTPAAK